MQSLLQGLNISFEDQKSKIKLSDGDGTHCYARKTSRDYEEEKPSLFLVKFIQQSQSRTTKLEQKNAKIFPFMA